MRATVNQKALSIRSGPSPTIGVFIHPHFTGSNVKPEAIGSDLVIEDVLSAIEKRTTQTKELVFLVDQSLARNKDSEAITNVAAR